MAGLDTSRFDVPVRLEDIGCVSAIFAKTCFAGAKKWANL